MIDHDRLFKELITTFFIEFIELFFPEVAAYLEPDPLEFLDKEIFTDIISGERRATDIVVKAKFRGQDSFFIVHIENQAWYQKEFGKRMFRYFARLSEKHNLPVYPIAVLSFDYPLTSQPQSYEVKFPDKLVLQFNYRVIQINSLNWRNFLQNPNPVATALMARMRIKKSERRQVKLQCLRLLVSLRLDPARMKLISGFIDTYLRLNPREEKLLKADIAEQLEPEEQEGIMQIVTSWMEEGLQIGRQEGRLEGRLEGQMEGKKEEGLAIILRQLNRRIGGITPTLQAQLHQLSVLQLENLADALLDFSTPNDLVNWLEQNLN